MSGADVLSGEAAAGADAVGAADELSAPPSPWARYGPPGSPGRQLRHGAIGQVAARSLRFGSATGRSLAVRRAVGVPASVQANGAGLATVRAPRWWRRSARAVEATGLDGGAGTTTSPAAPTASAAGAVSAAAELPARGLRRVVRAVPTEESHGPGSLSVTAAPRTLPMRLPAEVTAAGVMITSLDRRRRTAPPPPRDADAAQVGSPGKPSGAGSTPDLSRRGTSAGTPQAAVQRDAEHRGPVRRRPTVSAAAVTRDGAGAARPAGASTPGTPGRATPVSRFVRRRLAASEAARAAGDARASGDARAAGDVRAAGDARASRPAVSGHAAGTSDVSIRTVRRVPLSTATLGVSPDGSTAVADGATRPLRRAVGAPVLLRPAGAGAVGAPVGGGRVRSDAGARSAGPRSQTRPTRGDASDAMRASASVAPAAALAASRASSAMTRSAGAPAPSAQPAAVRSTSAQTGAAHSTPTAPTAVRRSTGVPTAAQLTSARPGAAQPTSRQPGPAQPTAAVAGPVRLGAARPATAQPAGAQPGAAPTAAGPSMAARPTAAPDADARPHTTQPAIGRQMAGPTATTRSAADAAGIAVPAGAGADSASGSATSVPAQRLAPPDAVVDGAGTARRSRRGAGVRRYSGLPVAIDRLAVGHGVDDGLVGRAASAGRVVRHRAASAVASARHAAALTVSAERGAAAGAGRGAAALVGGTSMAGGTSIAGGTSLQRVAPRGVLPMPAGTRAGVPTDTRSVAAVRRVEAAPARRSWSLGIVGPDGPGIPASPNRPDGPDGPRAPMRRRADPAATTVRRLVAVRPTPVSAPARGDVRRSARAPLGAVVSGSAGPVEVAASTAVRGSATPTSHRNAGAALTAYRSAAGAHATSHRSPAAPPTLHRSAAPAPTLHRTPAAARTLHRSAAAPVELPGFTSGFVVLPPRTTGLGGRPGGPAEPSSARAGRRPSDRPAPSGPTDAVRRSVAAPAPAAAGTSAGSVPARLAALVAAEAARAFESTSAGRTGWAGPGTAFATGPGGPGGPSGLVGGPAGGPGAATVLRTTEGAVMSPSAADRVSRSWSPPEDPSQPALPPAVMDELVDRVVERLEDRVVEELERRGRRRTPGVF